MDGIFGTPTGTPMLRLKGLDAEEEEEIPYGHVFPNESESFQDLFNEHLVEAPHLYCKRIIKEGSLPNFPEIPYQAVFSIEGKHVKYSYNNMLRRQGYQAPKGGYRVQDRYGVWVCKDFIPVQQKNTWITTKGSEFTRLHAFVNCQKLRLTANRGSVDNTPSEVLEDLRVEVEKLYKAIIESDDWRDLEWLEEEAAGYRTVEKEQKDLDRRVQKANNANVATYRDILLVEPYRESGVFSVFLQLSTIDSDLFPFRVVDYDTHEGIDVIAKGDSSTPIQSAQLFYVEFKHTLQTHFNHSFDNVHSIVCWDTAVKHDGVLEDLKGTKRKMNIVSPADDGEHTRYFLDDARNPHRIEVIVLKDFLRQKLKVEFRPRTEASAV